MMEFVLNLLENPAVLVALATLAAMVIVWYSKKKEWVDKWMPLIIRVYNEVEKMLPDTPGFEKLEAFMDEFEKQYSKRTGKVLNDSLSDIVRDLVSVVAFKDSHETIEVVPEVIPDVEPDTDGE